MLHLKMIVYYMKILGGGGGGGGGGVKMIVYHMKILGGGVKMIVYHMKILGGGRGGQKLLKLEFGPLGPKKIRSDLVSTQDCSPTLSEYVLKYLDLHLE